VFSCDYQLTAANYFSETGIVQNARIPFYPSPDDAVDGACCCPTPSLLPFIRFRQETACNLRYVYDNISHIEQNNCSSSAGNGDLGDCSCCQFSTAVSKHSFPPFPILLPPPSILNYANAGGGTLASSTPAPNQTSPSSTSPTPSPSPSP
jgi:hypothetical protein